MVEGRRREGDRVRKGGGEEGKGEVRKGGREKFYFARLSIHKTLL